MANIKKNAASTAPAGAAAAATAPAAPAKKPSGFERGREYTPVLGLEPVDLSDIEYRKRGVQEPSKYAVILDKVKDLPVGKGFVVTEEEAAGLSGKKLHQRLSPFVRRYSQKGNKNGALVCILDKNERVIIVCVERSSVKAPRKRAPKESVAETTEEATDDTAAE